MPRTSTRIRTRTRGWTALALLASLALAALTTPAAAADPPSDEAVLPNLAFDVHQEVDVGELVALWARRFEALAVIDPALRPIKVRFVTPVSALTWRATKLLLEFHDVVVIESQPVPGSPWVIRAHHRTTAPMREPAPYPLVDGAKGATTGCLRSSRPTSTCPAGTCRTRPSTASGTGAGTLSPPPGTEPPLPGRVSSVEVLHPHR